LCIILDDHIRHISHADCYLLGDTISFLESLKLVVQLRRFALVGARRRMVARSAAGLPSKSPRSWRGRRSRTRAPAPCRRCRWW
jgi:hypothetical protein